MSQIPWKHAINFASALLLHSCITVLLKEALNVAEISRRLVLRWWQLQQRGGLSDKDYVRTSIVLDAYTSIFSNDLDGELAELYFTNTGFILLAVSLASSVAMNLLLSSLLLNMVVAATFGLAFFASLVKHHKNLSLPVMALRRAGRFIWSDTPFVNFFSLIYIATVLHGRATLRLQDYVTFRSIAVLELVFMKAKMAASDPEYQTEIMRRLIASEWVVVNARPDCDCLRRSISIVERKDMVPFTTRQRLSVMLFKTSVGFRFGCLQGSLGPAKFPVPAVGCYTQDIRKGWKVYRLSEDVVLIADCFAQSSPKGRWARFIAKAHGVLLRRLGKIRVIYLIRTKTSEGAGEISLWHSNINLVTGVTKDWLDASFRVAQTHDSCVVAGNDL